MEPHLTRVETIYIPRVRTVSLRFGEPVQRHRLNKAQRLSFFRPDSTFAVNRWHGCEQGTTLWQLSILRAVWPQQSRALIAGVTPGAEVLLRVSSIANVRQMLALIRGIEARGIGAVAVNPDYWREVHRRLTDRMEVPEYTVAHHLAFINGSGVIST